MVLLTVGAQLVETVIVRGVLFTAEAGVRVLYWAGSTAVGLLWPAAPQAPTEVERMRESIQRLEEQVASLIETNNIANVHADAGSENPQELVSGEKRKQAEQV